VAAIREGPGERASEAGESESRLEKARQRRCGGGVGGEGASVATECFVVVLVGSCLFFPPVASYVSSFVEEGRGHGLGDLQAARFFIRREGRIKNSCFSSGRAPFQRQLEKEGDPIRAAPRGRLTA